VPGEREIGGAGVLTILFKIKVGAKESREISEAELAEVTRVLNINATGTFLVTSVVSTAMKIQTPNPIDASSARGDTRGSIVNLGSAASFVPVLHRAQYTASKHAVIGLTKNAGKLYKHDTLWGVLKLIYNCNSVSTGQYPPRYPSQLRVSFLRRHTDGGKGDGRYGGRSSCRCRPCGSAPSYSAEEANGAAGRGCRCGPILK